MKPCRFAGPPCNIPATTTVRITGIGIRDVCSTHLGWMQNIGMDVRVVDPGEFIPEWRKRSLLRDMSGVR